MKSKSQSVLGVESTPNRTCGALRAVDSDGTAAEALASVPGPSPSAVAAFSVGDTVSPAAGPDAAVTRVAWQADAGAVISNPTIASAVNCTRELAGCTAVAGIASAGLLATRRPQG